MKPQEPKKGATSCDRAVGFGPGIVRVSGFSEAVMDFIREYAEFEFSGKGQ